MDTSIASSAVQTAAQTTSSTGGSIGMTLLQIAVVACVAAVACFILKKNGWSEVRHEIGDMFDGIEQDKKGTGYGNYLLNIWDDAGRRKCIALMDNELRAGEYILICRRADKKALNDAHCRQIIELEDLRCSKARCLKGEKPIVIRKDYDGELYLSFGSDQVCKVQSGPKGSHRITPFAPEHEAFLAAEITEYGREPIFYINGMPVAMSINPKYLGKDGKEVEVDFGGRGESLVFDKKVVENLADIMKTPEETEPKHEKKGKWWE